MISHVVCTRVDTVKAIGIDLALDLKPSMPYKKVDGIVFAAKSFTIIEGKEGV